MSATWAITAESQNLLVKKMNAELSWTAFKPPLQFQYSSPFPSLHGQLKQRWYHVPWHKAACHHAFSTNKYWGFTIPFTTPKKHHLRITSQLPISPVWVRKKTDCIQESKHHASPLASWRAHSVPFRLSGFRFRNQICWPPHSLYFCIYFLTNKFSV